MLRGSCPIRLPLARKVVHCIQSRPRRAATSIGGSSPRERSLLDGAGGGSPTTIADELGVSIHTLRITSAGFTKIAVSARARELQNL